MHTRRSREDRTEHRAGRKRSEISRKAILEAALALVQERGYAALTMDGIAARAGVGKQTIYRWWSSKAAVLLDALKERAEAEVPLPDQGSLVGDLEAFFRATFAAAVRPGGVGPLLTALMAEAQLDSGFAREFLEGLIAQRREVLGSLLARGVARGELPECAELDMLADVLFGFFWYRLLLRHAPLDERAARQLAHLALGTLPGVVP